MNPFVQALVALFVQILQTVIIPFLLKLFQKHVVAQSPKLQALPKAELRAEARQWVKDMLAEFGNDLVTKNLVPGFLKPFLPLVESAVEQAIESALDAAGL